jgi:hypothetical protein
MKSRIREAVVLVQRLYELHAAGGPLHVQLDDGNLDMPSGMEPWYGTPDKHDAETHEVCDLICALMTPMTLYQRRLVCRLAFA